MHLPCTSTLPSEAGHIPGSRLCIQAKGGSFGQGAEKELYRFRLGDNSTIAAVEEAVVTMKPGGIRRLIVPVELGYPDNDMNKKGPKPTTFSVRIRTHALWNDRWMHLLLEKNGRIWYIQNRAGTDRAALRALQGQRALDFVLKNQGLIDKTLLIDVELVKIL